MKLKQSMGSSMVLRHPQLGHTSQIQQQLAVTAASSAIPLPEYMVHSMRSDMLVVSTKATQKCHQQRADLLVEVGRTLSLWPGDLGVGHIEGERDRRPGVAKPDGGTREALEGDLGEGTGEG